MLHFSAFEVKEHPASLYDKVSLYKGDITELEVDAIVNAGKCLVYLFAVGSKLS